MAEFLDLLKLLRHWKAQRRLQGERNYNRALTRSIQELRMKGASFDLSKEPQRGIKEQVADDVAPGKYDEVASRVLKMVQY
ncbi:hypothetical protein RJ641_032183 [Dillenia turbinata]|uniref:Uncharacterized protein n=1 Tax=Dillenia turbinata TaxID=194707 RepID=A0AAN8VR67_9MAGN